VIYEDLEKLYDEMKNEFGDDAYKHVSELLAKAKIIHKLDWIKAHPNGDHEQSWRSFKGKNLEKLIQYIIVDEVEELGLRVVNGNLLEHSENLPKELSIVKRNLTIDYGKNGMYLPDADIVIYDPNTYKVLVLISVKSSMRERITETGYWKLKLLENKNTRNIKVYFVTLDEDESLTRKYPESKGRAIVESDLDETYVLTEEDIEESDKVKPFSYFIEDLKELLENEY